MWIWLCLNVLMCWLGGWLVAFVVDKFVFWCVVCLRIVVIYYITRLFGFVVYVV